MKRNTSPRRKGRRHPFGTDVKRFHTLGLHPKLTHVGKSDLGPGQYDAKAHECAYKAHQCTWARKMATEEFSEFLDYRNAEILETRAYRKTCTGPGWTEVPDDRLDRGITFAKERRFRSFIADDNPPPGSYTIKEPRNKFSDLPTFEWDGLQNRFKSTTPDYRQAPNRYSPPLKHITDKKVSKRGPYDTFTGPRDGTTIRNHFAPPDFQPPDKYYHKPGLAERILTDKDKRAYGVFLRAVRFPRGKRVLVTRNFASFLRESDYPGPNRYDIEPELPQPGKWVANRYAFNSSNVHARPPFRHTIHPGPERYRARWPKCPMQHHAPSWMFSSKTSRQFYHVENYNY